MKVHVVLKDISTVCVSTYSALTRQREVIYTEKPFQTWLIVIKMHKNLDSSYRCKALVTTCVTKYTGSRHSKIYTPAVVIATCSHLFRKMSTHHWSEYDTDISKLLQEDSSRFTGELILHSSSFAKHKEPLFPLTKRWVWLIYSRMSGTDKACLLFQPWNTHTCMYA